jgi:predicted ATPase
MEGKRFLHSIKLTNLLSYGSEGVSLELEPLNVLIGPNASGKSNLIEAIGLLAATPRDLTEPFRDGGTVADWIWKGEAKAPAAEIEVSLHYEALPLRYRLAFGAANARLSIRHESLEDLRAPGTFCFQNEGSRVQLEERPSGIAGIIAMGASGKAARDPNLYMRTRQQSLFSQIKDPNVYPELTYVGELFGDIRLFRNWQLGRENPVRRPQDVNLPDDFLLESSNNLGLVLNDLQNRRDTWRVLVEKLKLVYEGVVDVTTKVQGGTIQVFFHEEGLSERVPAARLSDGILHYLGLLTILLHPDPPPLICIEKPEVGLHPDILPKVADMLVEAAQRTQLIVTTQSTTLVSRLSEVPESVVVCERDLRGTSLRRLEPSQMKEWLERYLLGELWAMGEIGGNRW